MRDVVHFSAIPCFCEAVGVALLKLVDVSEHVRQMVADSSEANVANESLAVEKQSISLREPPPRHKEVDEESCDSSLCLGGFCHVFDHRDVEWHQTPPNWHNNGIAIEIDGNLGNDGNLIHSVRV